MSSVRTLARVTAAVLGVALAPVLARETFDIATFEPPFEWQRIKADGLALFRAPAGDGQIAVFPSVVSAASPAENFNGHWARFVAPTLGSHDAPTLATPVSSGSWTVVIGATQSAHNDVSMSTIQVTTSGFGCTMSMVVSLPQGRYAAEIGRFFETLDFRVDSGSPPTGAAGKAAPLELARNFSAAIPPAGIVNGLPTGLFYRLRFGIISGARVELETRLFLPNNRIARILPLDGAARFDSARCSPDTCGSIRFESNALLVTWDGGQEDQWPLAILGDAMLLDGSTFRPARALTAEVLTGEWSGSQALGNASANVYRFDHDGTFSFGTDGNRTASGRYGLDELALTLSYSEGSKKRLTVFAAGTSEPLGLIAIDGEVYSRR